MRNESSIVLNSPTATKMHAVVAGQTSVKAPEKAAFEKYLPEDVHIVSCHSLHGPTVNPVGQPLVSTEIILSLPLIFQIVTDINST